MFITCKNITKSYKTGEVITNVLNNISISLNKGQIGMFLGPSGSGKSTLLNIIGGIDKSDSGKVIVNNIELTKLNDKQLTQYRRQNVGFIFQFYNLIPGLTAEENVEVASNISENPLNIDEIFKAVGMLDKKKRFPRELSGGEQQRISIARAIIKNPKLLLCDEPTGALDYTNSKEILKLIQYINNKFNTTIIIVSHNTALSDMAHKVFKLKSGEIEEEIINKNVLPAERIEW